MYHCEQHVLVEIYRFIRETNSKRQLGNMILIFIKFDTFNADLQNRSINTSDVYQNAILFCVTGHCRFFSFKCVQFCLLFFPIDNGSLDEK